MLDLLCPCEVFLFCFAYFRFGFFFEGSEMPLACVTDFQTLARERLSKSSWDYIDGGAGEGVTRDDNVAAFKKFGLLDPFFH